MSQIKILELIGLVSLPMGLLVVMSFLGVAWSINRAADKDAERDLFRSRYALASFLQLILLGIVLTAACHSVMSQVRDTTEIYGLTLLISSVASMVLLTLLRAEASPDCWKSIRWLIAPNALVAFGSVCAYGYALI